MRRQPKVPYRRRRLRPACWPCSARWCGWSAHPAPSSSSSRAPMSSMTLIATVIFFATGLRLRLVFMPLLLLLILLNVGYTIGAIPLHRPARRRNWIATSWYMAVTVMFFAMVISEDTAARLDMLRRGLIVGAMIASLAGDRRLFQSRSRRPRSADAVRARARHLQGPERARRVPDPAGAVRAAKRRVGPARQSRSATPSRFGIIVAGDPAGILARGLGRADPHVGLHAGADGR